MLVSRKKRKTLRQKREKKKVHWPGSYPVFSVKQKIKEGYHRVNEIKEGGALYMVQKKGTFSVYGEPWKGERELVIWGKHRSSHSL